MVDLPRYDDLPEAPEGGRSAWGLFGEGDSVGLMNLVTPERVLEASKLVRRGALFPLDAPLDAFSPAIASGRGIPRHRVLHAPGTIGFDDVYDNFFPQASSQWDSLGHVGYGPNAFYNGATEDDVASGRRNTIEHWAKRGIATRGVLLDLPRTLADAGRPYEPGSNTAFSVDDLELARERAGVEFRTGDLLIVHTGFAAWFVGAGMRERTEVARGMTTPGLASGEDMCRYLWDAHVVGVASDTFAVEVFPPDISKGTMGFMHRILIGQFGMALGELWWTEDLAADCEGDGVHDFFLVSAPLHARGGIGSPPNAIAIK
ncbi:MAG: cyclase family protein [Acidimicrobiales bacterium]